MCLSSCFLSRLLCSCIEWCNCKNSPQNRHKNTLFAHSIKLLSQQSQIYATRTEPRRAAQKIAFNMRSKNRQLSSPQAVIQNVHIKLNLGNQVQKRRDFMHTIHSTLALHAQRACSKVSVRNIVSSSSLFLSKNRSHFLSMN